MTKKIICKRCMGQGRLMGGGMMMIECDDCDGVGKLIQEPEISFIDRESKAYKKAIKKIRALDPELTQEQAEDIFSKEFDRMSE